MGLTTPRPGVARDVSGAELARSAPPQSIHHWSHSSNLSLPLGWWQTRGPLSGPIRQLGQALAIRRLRRLASWPSTVTGLIWRLQASTLLASARTSLRAPLPASNVPTLPHCSATRAKAAASSSSVVDRSAHLGDSPRQFGGQSKAATDTPNRVPKLNTRVRFPSSTPLRSSANRVRTVRLTSRCESAGRRCIGCWPPRPTTQANSSHLLASNDYRPVRSLMRCLIAAFPQTARKGTELASS